MPRPGLPHPRWAGSFAQVPGHYARDLGLLTITEAVRKTTGPPAARSGLDGRGVMRDGVPADKVVFDLRTVWIRPLTTIRWRARPASAW